MVLKADLLENMHHLANCDHVLGLCRSFGPDLAVM